MTLSDGGLKIGVITRLSPLFLFTDLPFMFLVKSLELRSAEILRGLKQLVIETEPRVANHGQWVDGSLKGRQDGKVLRDYGRFLGVTR